MTQRWKGEAPEQAMRLLVQIADLPGDSVLRRNERGWFEMMRPDGGQFEIGGELDMPSIRFRTAAEPSTEASLHVWADAESEAYWYPFASLPELARSGRCEMLDFGHAVLRVRELLNRVYFDSDDQLAGFSARAIASASYLRLRSGITSPWYVSLARPFEVLLDDSDAGDDGLLMAFGELPPGLADLGERACVTCMHGDKTEVTVRPVVATFNDELGNHGPVTVSAAHRRLIAFGFTAEEVDLLDKIAADAAGVARADPWDKPESELTPVPPTA